MVVLGCDIARLGGDKNVVAVRVDNAVTKLERWARADTMQTVGHILMLISEHKPETVVIDTIGIGAGVYDRLREMNLCRIVAFNALEKTVDRDKSGTISFLNKRAAAWWHLRELLDPGSEEPILLPPDDGLIGDLTSCHWKISSNGRIQMESKEDIRNRLGRSPDAGDAVVMAFYAESRSVLPFSWIKLPEEGVA